MTTNTAEGRAVASGRVHMCLRTIVANEVHRSEYNAEARVTCSVPDGEQGNTMEIAREQVRDIGRLSDLAAYPADQGTTLAQLCEVGWAMINLARVFQRPTRLNFN